MLDDAENFIDIGGFKLAFEAPRQLGIVTQIALLVQPPDLATIVAGAQLRRETAEVIGHVLDVAQQHRGSAVVAGCIHSLRQIDDDRTVLADQHVEFRKVAMDEADAKHLHYIGDDPGVKFPCLLHREHDVIQTRRRISLCIADHVHEQDTVDKTVCLRHSHTSRRETTQRIYLGVQPGLFLLLLTIAAAFADRSGTAAVLDRAPFLILHRLLEAALACFLVNLRAAHILATSNHIHLSFLATHQLTEDFIDEAVINQWLQSCWYFHGLPVCFSKSVN